MGEFPEPAIQGNPVVEPVSTPVTSTSAGQPMQATDPSPSTESLSQSETKTVLAPISTLVTSKVEMSSSHVPSAIRPSTVVEDRTSAPTTKLPPVTSIVQSTSVVQSISIVQPTSIVQAASILQTTSALISQSTSIQIITPASAPAPISTTSQRTSKSFSTIPESSASSNTLSTTEIVTRPIITPTSTRPPLATTAPTVNSHLSLGAIVGIVSAIVVILVVAGMCIIIGPRRALRKLGVGANRDEEKIDYEEWERTRRESGTWTRRSASVGANSDWWRPPPGAFPNRPSTVSLCGPGMAGVGAGKGVGIPENPTSPVPRRMSQRRVEERGAVRSGWFATSMVRGASLLSLGSFVRPPMETSNTRGSERMSRMGTGGSAGKRFQELYRRERASGSANSTRLNEPTEYLATINEMGERQSSIIGQRRVPGEMNSYRPRSTGPKVRRPSRLATSYVPDIVVQDTTLPNLSSVSSVTHESGGRGYDADAEIERRPCVI
ncbi:unnamed protein product [Rhizoctonia solani]|uniref:Transmembrane protein n=1 Tax=Rhizoctonia solani TaxID=456999 RepID=A0A8H2XCS3_9AGAM|nr:unnamed protein product [Rhizoctonia solani]